jgi:hypothetical protein
VPDARFLPRSLCRREHRLLAYYRDCVEAEGRTDVAFDAGHPAIALLTEGAEPAVAGPTSLPVPVPRPAQAWAIRQLTSAQPGPACVGYPLTVGRRAGRRIVAPLFHRECRFEWSLTGLVAMRAVDAPLEINPEALALLGWDHDERAALLEDLACRSPQTFADAAARLGRAGVDLRGLDPRALRPVPPAVAHPTVANTALLFTGEPAATARGVLAELEQLMVTSAGQFSRGPLGILLGSVRPAQTVPDSRPTPIVLPSNAAQDGAISASLGSPLTVITGPPGTGKSQVLVNAVAATVVAGQTVLFASRTNRAVDVVFQRLERFPAAVPLRAGRAALRAQAAHRIRAALAPAAPEPPATAVSVTAASVTAASARATADTANAWAALSTRLAPLSNVLAERHVQLDRVRDARAHADRVAAAWGWDLAGSAPPEARSQAAAYQAEASRAAAALVRLPPEEAVRARLAGYEAARLVLGRELWQLAWGRRANRAPGRARAGAAVIADCLERGRPSGAIAEFRRGLEAFPVWGLTNLAAAACLPLAPRLFDLVIIDEAAQCDIASALPLLARARRALIIGDEWQLGHVSRLRPEHELAISRRHRLDAADLDVVSQRRRSLYEMASARLGRPPLLLDEHYRCHPRIIGFSNSRIYSGRLTIRAMSAPGGGLLWLDVAGSFGRGPGGRSARNPEEALAVVQQLRQEQRRDPEARIGVVAPFRAQVELIRQLLAAPDGGPVQRAATVTIDTVHRFQGDERDVMLLSPTVSSSMPNFFRGVAGQPRLLNVAVTRARHRLVVIGDRDACLATGGLLAELADYADPITGGPGPERPGGDRPAHQPGRGRPS